MMGNMQHKRPEDSVNSLTFTLMWFLLEVIMLHEKLYYVYQCMLNTVSVY